jgi:hypothetical protein
MAQERVLNPLGRKVMRKHFPVWETRFGIAFSVVLVLLAGWIMAQRNNYDPGDRDISTEVLVANQVEDTLYKAPLVAWREPGSVVGGGGVDLGIFPASLLDGGWTLDGRVETYTRDDVYEKINGAAEQYISYGFQRLHYVTITDGQASITTEIYDQGRFANTLGIFAAQRDASRGVETDEDLFFYPTPVGAVAGVGPYYFKVAADRQDENVVTKAQSLVSELAKLPRESGATPRAYSVLTRELGVSFDDLAFVAQDAFQFAFASDFWFGATDGGEARYFLHEAEDASAAAELFDKIVAEQKYEHQTLAEADGKAVLQHEFLETLFVIEHRGPFVFGVENAADRSQADTASRRIEEVVRGEA